MEFSEVSVKDSPGLCRCCLSEGCYKDLGTEYTWMKETEVYADMLLDCFDVGITQHNDGPNGPKRLICEVCITRLRDACNFKKQVLESETRFIDMLGRGEFRSKVLVYSPQSPLKTEAVEVTFEETDATEVDYLDDIDFQPSDTEPLSTIKREARAERPRAEPRKRGRPRKEPAEPPEKKHKKTELKKPKVAKGQKNSYYPERLTAVRTNICTILRYGNLTPFNWNTAGFRCFYCAKLLKDCTVVRNHTGKHVIPDLDAFIKKTVITKDVPIKVDVTELSCKVCNKDLDSLDDLISHVVEVHKETYNDTVGICFFPFVLDKVKMNCRLCSASYDNFSSMIGHMYKQHIYHSFICQLCGNSFKDHVRLKRHINLSHLGHRCSFCGKIFEAFHKLDKHKQRFHGQIKTIHECNLCSEKFENNYLVKVHMGKVHNVEKYRLKCQHCPKICTTKGALRLHLQSLHPSVKYQCDLCEYTTGVKWQISLHKRKHFGTKEYACSICERNFGRASNLRTHMKVHTGCVGRVCRVCRKGFTDAEALQEHEKETHYYDYK